MMPSDTARPKLAPEIVVLCSDTVWRTWIADALSDLPADIFVTADGYEANYAALQPSCRILFTDAILPPWPDVRTFDLLRATNPDLRIVFLGEDTALPGEIDDVLCLPIDRRHLASILSTAGIAYALSSDRQP